MAVEYTIPAIPTIYAGRRYRSRLEARWAAFFDLIGWHSEYEPCDLGLWSPDFCVHGKPGSSDLLVEVKPIYNWDKQTAHKMGSAIEPLWSYQKMLLLGVGPSKKDEWHIIGWYGEITQYGHSWSYACLCRDKPGRIDIISPVDTVPEETVLWDEKHFVPYDASQEWIEAANVTQWRGGMS